MNYLNRHGTRQTPRSQAIPGRDQVQNSAGGYVFSIDKWARLRRFLILGSESPTYYASSRKLTTENVGCVHECVKEDGGRTVSEICAVSTQGRAPQNDPALFALAVAISHGDNATKSHAAEALPEVARIGTHLYHFVAYAETMRGWGRTMRWAVQNWYDKNPDQLAYQAVKYRQRDGWSHRDLLRLAHPKLDAEHNVVFNWIAHGSDPEGNYLNAPLPVIIDAFERAQSAPDAAATAALVREFRLPREALKTEHLADPEVWRAMLDVGMPMTALIRNLANLTRYGIFESMDYRISVAEQITDAEALRKSRVHPLAVLTALVNYQAGHGDRGSNTWVPATQIIDALDEGFYASFANVKPSGKRTLIGLDVSSSMRHGRVANSQMTPALAAAAMALVTVHTEPLVEVLAFTTTPSQLPLSKRQRLDDVLRMTHNLAFGGTDCALPFLVARTDIPGPESFQVYTDNETWAGRIQPAQALAQYRAKSGINAKSCVIGLTATGFTIADPNDPGMLDVVGFDAAAPAVMADFAAGRV